MVETQRRLYNLGVFNRVQIAPQNPDGTDPDKGGCGRAGRTALHDRLRIRIRGAQTDPCAASVTPPAIPTAPTIAASPRGIFEISRVEHVRPRADAFVQGARQHPAVSRRSQLHGGQFSRQAILSLQLTGFADKTQDVNTFTSTRYEGAVPDRRENFALELRSSTAIFIAASRLPTGARLPRTNSALSQPTLVSGFGITYARDRRDNPADAKHGTFNTVDMSDRVESLGLEREFLSRLLSEFIVLSIRPRICVRALRALRCGTAYRQHDRGSALQRQCPEHAATSAPK